MFDFLKGGKTFLNIALDHPLEYYYLGETVHGTLTVENQNELKIQEGRIVLLYKEEYEYRYQHRETDSHGHSRHVERKSWNSEEQEVGRVVFLKAGTLPANSNQTFEFDLTIPNNAPPTMDGGQIVRLKWLVRATLDRKMASDFNNEVEIFVSALPSQADSSGEYGHSNEPGEAQSAFSLPSNEWVLGGTIEGEFFVRPQKNFDVTEVRVELVRSEHVARDLGNTYTEETKIKFAGETKLQAGQELKYPFQLTIPNPRPPSSRTNHSEVNWWLRGVLARRLRSDTQVEEGIWVYNTWPEESSSKSA